MQTGPARTIGLLLALSGISVACGSDGPSSSDVIDSHREALTAKLAAIDAGIAEVKRKGSMAAAGPLDPAPDFSTTGAGNAVVVVDTAPQAAGTPRSTVPLLRETSDAVRIARAAIAGEQRPSMRAKTLDALLGRVAAARYALIVVPILERRPSSAGTNFHAGHIKARAHLYDLDAGKRLAAFDVSATNAPEVLARADAVQARLDDELSYQYGEAIRAGITKHLPGATPPTSFGFTAW